MGKDLAAPLAGRIGAAAAAEIAPEYRTGADRRLFDIAADLRALEQLLYETGGDVSDEDVESVIDAWLHETHEAEAQKIDRYCALVRELELRAENRLREAGRIAKHAKADEAAAERLKARLKAYLDVTGKKKVEGLRFVVKVVGNGGKAPIVWDDPEKQKHPALLPKEFQRIPPQEPVPDMTAIREALEAGRTLAFAHIGERGSRLEIK